MHVVPASLRPLSPALQRTLFASTLKAALSAAFVAAPILLAPTAAHAQAQTRAYDIPGGPLGDVLGRYGREAGIALSFRPELTEGRHSNGLKGSYTAGGGLNTLLAGTGLQAMQQAGGSYVLDRQPGAGTTTLPAVTVTGAQSDLPEAYAGGQIARGGSMGVLGSMDVMETPFSTTNYTSQMLEDQQARTLADVVVNEASVRVMTSTGSFSEDFQIRGFNVTSGDVGFNGLYGLTSSNRMPAALMERVEVLKGPGTLMYGISPNGSIGGNINIVTKRAGDEPLTRLTTTYESKSILGAHLDMGRRYGDDNQWGIRFNGVYRNGQTSLDDGRQEFGLGALALDYRSPTLRWSLDTYSQRENVDNFRAQNGFKPGISHIPSAPSGHRAIYAGADLMSRDSAVASRLEYDISDHLMVYAAGGYRYGASEQDFPSARSFDAVDEQGNFRVINSWYDAYSRNKTGEIGARANFDTFGIKHRVSLAGSILKSEAGSFYLSAPLSQKIDSNIYHPVQLIPMTGDRQSPTKNSETTLSSIALTDTLSFANDRVLITGGLRKQQVKAENFNAAGAVTSSYDEGAISPLAGIVVRPLENVSVYGNFTSGLTRGGTAPATAANVGEVFAPYKSKQYEAGVKVDWDRVITTVSIFQIDRPNAMTDPVTNIYSFDGEQRNRGLELSAVGEVTRGLRVMASATFYDAKLQRTAGGVNQGNRASGVPKRTFNLGADWDLPWVQGLSLNARAIHTAATPYDAENTLTLPSWTRYDVGARYRTEVMGKQVTFRANVENVFNKSYWLSSSTLLTVATVAAPRTVLLSAQIEF
ncbi:TonB-dependent receptor [Achromobacter deleyi]|uniref:TonB-dependent receptor n=1 Tax=Achromobacter deleyi TaxID=1353891 RepID=UPI001F39E75F|nr:TonB-dependent receptor [Achromobacter deleyi]UIP21360.1 TonB-dependent receptor [Achromobacter deleyi]